jgi:multicomponent Na+:H+ antiporter subunit C
MTFSPLEIFPFQLYGLAGVLLFCICLYALITHEHILRKILALNIMASSVFLLFVAIARRNVTDIPDPAPHAMVLTGIVIAVSATAFALALVRRLYAQTGAVTLAGDQEDP